ncbi:MAG: ABC transporter permease [Chloroflexi bacterium]|nr:ABC transporter permease [Chloroflexota bacterium]
MARYEAITAAVEAEAAAPRPSLGFLRRLVGKRVAMAALVVIVIIYLAGILAPVVAPYGFADTDFANTFAGPSLEHPLGTDRLGRDMLSRVMWASQTTIIISAAALLTGGLALGVGLGLLAGYSGGRVDNLIMRVADAFFGLPEILLLLLITATIRPRVDDLFDNFNGWPVLGTLNQQGLPDYFLIFGALSLFGWVGMARIVRSQVLALRETDYVMAARAAGARTPRVLFHHLLPNVTNLIVVAVTFSLGAIAGTEIALTWLGIGIQPPHPSFGVMIFDGSGLTNLRAHPSLMLVPAVVVAALLFSFNLLGDALNDVLNPHRR